MKRRCLAFLPAAAILLFPLTAYANSSWAWLTETTPLTILPFAAVFTLVIETFAVIRFGKVQKHLKAAIVIALANLLSFAGGFFLGAVDPDGLYTVTEVIIHTPHYIVSALYLLLTLAIEFPAVYYSLRRDTDNETRFAASIIISNVLTTILVAFCEGIFAPGAW